MVVYFVFGNYENMLVNGILYYCKDKLLLINGVIRFGIVYRIDKDIFGFFMIVKNNYVYNFLVEQLKEYIIIREYEFICYGVVKEDKIIVDKFIGRNFKDRLKMVVVKDGKNVIIYFEVVERFDKFIYMRVRFEIGRIY